MLFYIIFNSAALPHLLQQNVSSCYCTIPGRCSSTGRLSVKLSPRINCPVFAKSYGSCVKKTVICIHWSQDCCHRFWSQTTTITKRSMYLLVSVCAYVFACTVSMCMVVCVCVCMCRSAGSVHELAGNIIEWCCLYYCPRKLIKKLWKHSLCCKEHRHLKLCDVWHRQDELFIWWYIWPLLLSNYSWNREKPGVEGDKMKER